VVLNDLGDEECCLSLNRRCVASFVHAPYEQGFRKPKEGSQQSGAAAEARTARLQPHGFLRGTRTVSHFVNVLQDRWYQIGLLRCNTVWAVGWTGGAPTTRVIKIIECLRIRIGLS